MAQLVVTYSGTGVQRLNASFSLTFFIFNDISFKCVNEAIGKQQQEVVPWSLADG